MGIFLSILIFFIIFFIVTLSINRWNFTHYLEELIKGWEITLIIGILIPYIIFSLIFYWKNFSKATSIIILAIIGANIFFFMLIKKKSDDTESSVPVRSVSKGKKEKLKNKDKKKN